MKLNTNLIPKQKKVFNKSDLKTIVEICDRKKKLRRGLSLKIFKMRCA